jgi:hypothetical protein
MRPGSNYWVVAMLFAPGLLVVTLGQRCGRGDEPSRLGRFFRFGGISASSSSRTASPSAPASESTVPASPVDALPPPEAAGPAISGPSVTPRIIPRPRVSRPATESDPIVTRITLNRSDDGNQFGMFLQVFADGTLIDSEGVHHVSQDALRPLVDALQAGELYRLKGHCGAPATDFVESVHVTVYERSLGRLRANAFSYSGNPQGCDGAVRNLHATLDALQAKITRPYPSTGASAGPISVPSTPMPTPPPGGSPHVIPLTPAS